MFSSHHTRTLHMHQKPTVQSQKPSTGNVTSWAARLCASSSACIAALSCGNEHKNARVQALSNPRAQDLHPHIQKPLYIPEAAAVSAFVHTPKPAPPPPPYAGAPPPAARTATPSGAAGKHNTHGGRGSTRGQGRYRKLHSCNSRPHKNRYIECNTRIS